MMPKVRNIIDAATREGLQWTLEQTQIICEPFIDADVRAFIMDGVAQFNIAATSDPSHFPANFVLRGERGDVLGGILGWIWGGWFQITHLWVAEIARGIGHGTRLMAEAEAYARARGAIGATVETHSFQAQPFLEQRGYEVFATLDDHPTGHAKFFLKKMLV